MQAIARMAMGFSLVLIASAGFADDKKDYAKLAVGTWEVTKTEGDGPSKGSEVELTKDNKVKITGERNGEKMSLEGSYKIDGAKMSLTLAHGGNERTMELTIDKLDEKTLALSNDTGKAEFTRKKK